MTTKTKKMDHIEIQSLLKRANITQEQLAAKIGCHQTAISKVIRRKLVSDRIECGIAEALGKSRYSLFQERLVLKVDDDLIKPEE